jgi:hypothetical protein
MPRLDSFQGQLGLLKAELHSAACHAQSVGFDIRWHSLFKEMPGV